MRRLLGASEGLRINRCPLRVRARSGDIELSCRSSIACAVGLEIESALAAPPRAPIGAAAPRPSPLRCADAERRLRAADLGGGRVLPVLGRTRRAWDAPVRLAPGQDRRPASFEASEEQNLPPGPALPKPSGSGEADGRTDWPRATGSRTSRRRRSPTALSGMERYSRTLDAAEAALVAWPAGTRTGKAGRAGAGRDKAIQGTTRHYRAREGRTRPGGDRQGQAGQGKGGPGGSGRDQTSQDRTGLVWRCQDGACIVLSRPARLCLVCGVRCQPGCGSQCGGTA